MAETKKIKAGSKVILLVGPKESRGKTFSVAKVNGDGVFLEGYRVMNRTSKITQENTENHRPVHHPVHISNVKLES